MQILKAGGLYFGLVFAAGFVLGTIRTLWITPNLGERTAELIESPLMLAVTVFAARFVVGFRSWLPGTSARLGAGLVGLGLLIAAETGVVLGLRRITMPEYVAGRDPVAGIVYVVLLAIFAVMPLLVGRGENR